MKGTRPYKPTSDYNISRYAIGGYFARSYGVGTWNLEALFKIEILLSIKGAGGF
jgi:hypothetical protein